MFFHRFLLFLSLTILFTSAYVYKTIYIDVPVNHFSFANKDTFKLRVLINDTFWTSTNGPIFFYTGNEGSIEDFAENTGFLWETAVEFGALIVFAEHRYYGTSLPFGNLSFTDKKYFDYLTSQQALADFVDVIYYINSKKWKGNDTENSYDEEIKYPVIAFGGSYGGMLAAWMRMKYPFIIEGSLASSAPILQFTGLTPCNSFFHVLTSAYGRDYSQCPYSVKMSWQAIDSMAADDEGKKWITDNWKLCSPISTTQDVLLLKGWLEDLYTNVGMTNYPYPSNFLMPLPGHPVKAFCEHMVSNSSKSKTEILSSLFDGISVLFNHTGTVQCLDYRGQNSIQSLDYYGWGIQSCMEMVMPLCTNGIFDMFEKDAWNISKVSDDCYESYKIRPSIDYIRHEYGGNNLKSYSNIIFSNGLLDPWSSGGVLHNVSSTVIAVLLPNSAHHLDLRAANQNDPTDIVNARILYKSIFKTWITNFNNKK